MNINYTESFNFKPIPSITPASDYWQNGTWKFNMPEITAGTSSQPSWQDIILSGNTALTLTNALADGINYLTLYGGTEQRNIPSEYTQVNYVTNTEQTMVDTGVKFDFSKNYEIELRIRGVVDSWYILQAREATGSPISGISGSSSGNKMSISFNGDNIVASQISRVDGHIYYLKGTVNNGNLTLYVKDETAGTEETVTGTYTVATGQSVNVGLFGNIARNYVGINSNVYFVRIKEDGNYIMNYVPCKQSTTAGFYDKVSGTFKTATYLSAGADVITPSPDTPMDIVSNNGVVKVNRNLYSTEYHDQALSQSDGVTTSSNTGVNVSTMVDCRTIKSFKITTTSPQGTFRIFKYRADNTFINASSTTTIGDIITLEDNVGFFRIQYNYSSAGTGTENILIYNSAYDLNGIYTDGTVETVEITGKNLLNPSSWNQNKAVITNASNAGTVIDYDGWSTTNFILVSPSTSYTWSSSSNSKFIHCYKSDGTYISSESVSTNNTKTITTPENTRLIRLQINAVGSVLTNLSQQLEQGSTATAYEPYTVLGSATAEMLLAVGSYQDEQEVLGGSVTRNTNIYVITGEEEWRTTTNATSFRTNNKVLPNSYDAITDKDISCICSHYIGTKPANGVNIMVNNSIKCGGITEGITQYIYVKSSLFETPTDVQNYMKQQYQAGTPVIIVFPKTTATTETVTGQALTTQAGTNIVEITQASIDNLELEVSFKQSTI